MNKRFLISVVGMFILSMGFGYLIHGVLLAPGYRALPDMFRAEQDAGNFFPYMLLAHVFLSIGFVWVYVKGKEDKPFLMQGVRFGIAVAFLVTVPMYLIYYAVQPMPGDLVCRQIAFDTVSVIVMGIVVAWTNK